MCACGQPIKQAAEHLPERLRNVDLVQHSIRSKVRSAKKECRQSFARTKSHVIN
jgi:hypothetical protein